MGNLRDGFFMQRPEGGVTPQELDALSASGMNSLQRSWTSGRLMNEANALAADELNLRAAGDVAGANALREQITGIQQRQQTFAPEYQELTGDRGALRNGLGAVGSYVAGQIGQGAASMVDPMAVSAGLAGVGRIAGAIPHPVAKAVGLGAQGLAVGIPYMMNQRQLTGEFANDAHNDTELMARTSPTQLRDAANQYGYGAAILDTALPSMVGRQVSGLSRAGSQAARNAAMGPMAKTGLGLLGEGTTEALQDVGSQYTQGILNPNRDTSGDLHSNIENFAGGFFGASPFAAAGAYSESAHNRVGAGVDAVKGAVGDTVDLLGQNPTVQRGIESAKATGKKWWQFGEQQVEDLKDGTTQEAVKDAIKNYKLSREDDRILTEHMPADVAASPEKANAWIMESDAKRREVVERRLGAMNDPESQALLAELRQSNFDPSQVDAAIDHIVDHSTTQGVMERVGERAGTLAQVAGRGAAAATKGAFGLAKNVAKGVKEGFTKKNMQIEGDDDSSYEAWQKRRAESGVGSPWAQAEAAALEQSKIGPEKPAAIRAQQELEQKKEASYRRAVLMGERLAGLSKQRKRGIADEQSLSDYMRELGYEINDLADSWGIKEGAEKPSKAAVSRQMAPLMGHLDRIAEDLNGGLGDMAGAAVEHMQREADPAAAPMFDILKDKVVQGGTNAGREARRQARDVAVSQLATLLPRRDFNEIVQAEGEDGLKTLFNKLDQLSRGHAARGTREALENHLGRETLNRMLETVGWATTINQPEPPKAKTNYGEANTSEFDKNAAARKLDKASDRSIYKFGGTLGLRSKKEYKDIFAVTKKLTPEDAAAIEIEGGNSVNRPQLFTADEKWDEPTQRSFGRKKIDTAIEELQDEVGYSSDNETNGWSVEARTAHDVMNDHKVNPIKRLALYRDYLRMDSQRAKTQSEKDALGAKSTKVKMLLGRLMAHQKKPFGPPEQWTAQQSQDWQRALQQAKESGYDVDKMDVGIAALDDHQLKAMTPEVDDYFKNRFVAVASPQTDLDPEKLNRDDVIAMKRDGKEAHDISRKNAEQAARGLTGEEAAAAHNKVLSLSNILHFPMAVKGEVKDVPIKASDLVRWSKKAADSRGTSMSDSELSHSEAKTNRRYFDDLINGIYAFAAEHGTGMPYKINGKGEREYFEKGKPIPPSLVLANAQYGYAVGQTGFRPTNRSRLGLAAQVDENGKVRNPEQKEANTGGEYQEEVAQDQDKDEPFVADAPNYERGGSEFAALSDKNRDFAEKLAERLYEKNPDTWLEEFQRLMPDFPGATQFHQRKAGESYAKTEDDEATQLDFKDETDAPAEFEAQQRSTEMLNDKYKPPTNALHGMSSARHNADGVMAAMYRDPREGDREAITMLRSALRMGKYEDYRKKSFDDYRVATLIRLISNDREEMPGEKGKYRPLTHLQYFENAGATPELINILRRGSAQVLLQEKSKTNMTEDHKVKLARVLLDDPKVNANTYERRLQAFVVANGGPVQEDELRVNWGDPSKFGEKIAPKIEPHIAPPPQMQANAGTPASDAGTPAWALSEDEIAGISGPPPKDAPKTREAVYRGDDEAIRQARNRLQDQGIIPETPEQKWDREERARKARNAAAAKGGAAAPLGKPSGGVQVSESQASGYRDRTAFNAASAGTTVALANDFTTAGERLTKNVAGGKYVAIDLNAAIADPKGAGEHLAEQMKALGSTTLNVAGNGIYTLAKDGLTQDAVNKGVYEVIAAAHAVRPITKIVSGGQTGVDIAGAVAAKALGIPAQITLPKGYVQRGVDGVDRQMGKDAIERQIEQGAAAVKGVKRNNMVSAVATELATSRDMMRALGFKSAPEGFTDFAAKLLADPDQDPVQFVKDAAKALSYVLTDKQHLKDISAAVTASGLRPFHNGQTAMLAQHMPRKEAAIASYRALVEGVLRKELAARTEAHGKLLGRLMEIVQGLISRFKEFTGTAKFEDVVRNKLNTLYEKNLAPLDLKANYAKVSFQQAVDGDPTSAKVLAHMSTFKDASITGSIVLAEQGSIYRDAANMLHDLDFVVQGTEAAAEAHLRAGFPDAVQVYDFRNEQGVKARTFIVPPKGATIADIQRKGDGEDKGRVLAFKVMRDGKEIGRTWNDSKGEHKLGISGTFVDLFTESGQTPMSVIPFVVDGKQYRMSSMGAGAIFDAKLKFRREKDTGDYLNFVPNVGRKLNAMATRIHEELGRPGFAATHDSPKKHAGVFDWRTHRGTGEGNDMAGAGTYLSTADGVHRSYKNQFTAQVKYDATEAVKKSPEYSALQRELNALYKRGIVPADEISAITARMFAMEDAVSTGPSPTYEVSVNIAPHEMYDWNKSLADQPQLASVLDEFHMTPEYQKYAKDLKLQQRLGAAGYGYVGNRWSFKGNSVWVKDHTGAVQQFTGASPIEALNKAIDHALTGEELYRAFADALGSNAKASDFLQEHGILGHQYNASARQDSTHPNYVVYDDSKITTNYVHFNKQKPDGQHVYATGAEMAAAREWLEKVAPGTILNFIKEAGYSGEYIEAENTINVSTTAAAGILGTTYHEGLHKFFGQFVRSNPQLLKVFERYVNDPKVVGRINELLEGYPEAQAQLADGEERLAYAFQFWKAGLLHVDTPTRSIFQKIGALFRRVMGMVRDSEHALAIFQAFDEGRLANPSVAGQVIAKQLSKGSGGIAFRKRFDGLIQGLAAAVLPAEVILGENQHSATARKLAKMMFSNPASGEAGTPGYLNAKRAKEKQFTNRVTQLLENMSQIDQDQVQRHMQAETPVDQIKVASVRDAVASIRQTMSDFYDYMRQAGLDIGKVENYYPVVWDVDSLIKNKGEFVKMLATKYAKEMNAKDPYKAAERIHTALINRYGVDEVGLHVSRTGTTDPNAAKKAMREDGVLAPFFAGQEGRTLPWLAGADREKYLNKNMVHTITNYFHQGVRAAEYMRRFGEDGYMLERMLIKIRGEINEAGRQLYGRNPESEVDRVEGNTTFYKPTAATKENQANREKWIARQMRDVSMAVGAIEGTLGKDITPNMRKFNSYMIAYQNVRLLPYMIFSSFVDPLAQVARGAPISAALETFMYGMRAVFRSWADLFRDMPKERVKDEWTKLAEHIGAVEVAMFNHHVAEEYSSLYMTPGAKKINDTLFKLNGMEAWDRANRTMATKWAVRFIETHRALPDRLHSKRWLAELGLTPETIPVNADGNLITTAEELSAVKNISMEQARFQIEAVHNALRKWVEGAVITPNAAQRPGWSSDPNYASVFHLKQFSYSFQRTIMKRATNEMEHGNLAPIAALAGFIPTMICADIMKGLIQGAGSLPPYMAGYDAGDWLLHGMKRSGLGGVGDIGVNAMEDWSSLGGPGFEQAIDAIRDPIERTGVKAMPVHAMYEYLYRGGVGVPTPA